MNILVFGKTGQVAQALAHVPGNHANMRFLDRYEADLSDPRACAQLIHHARPDAVINAAAFTDVDGAETDPDRAHIINAAAPGAMAVACAQLGIAFLHISTDYVFDGTGNMARAPDAATAPINAYGHSKLAGEAAIQAAAGRYAILRTSWVFSAQGQNFVKTMLRLSDSHSALNIVADQIGGPTPASAIAASLVAMAHKQVAAPKSGIWHLSGTPAVSWADFAREIFHQAQRKVCVTDIPSTAYPSPAPRPHNSRLDCATLTSDFGIMPPEWKPALATILRESGA